MTRSDRQPTARRPLASSGPLLQVRFVDEDGAQHTLAAELARAVPFEYCLPMRAFTHRRDQRHTPGDYWAAVAGDLIGCESYLERQWMTALDFDPQVAALSSQPMTFLGADPSGTWRATPDIFARLADGTGQVIEVKNPQQLKDPKVLLTAERVKSASAAIGLGYRLVGALDPQLWANLRWLTGYRRPLAGTQENLAARILALAERPTSIDDLLSFLHPAALARPVIFHLLWHGRLVCDMTAPLRGASVVHRAENAK